MTADGTIPSYGVRNRVERAGPAIRAALDPEQRGKGHRKTGTRGASSSTKPAGPCMKRRRHRADRLITQTWARPPARARPPRRPPRRAAA